jgi:hypothetical protein
MDNRGKNNVDLIHASEKLLDSISAIAETWPKSTGFIDACTSAKRSALIYNTELSEVPWTWTRVRWSFDTMVKEVKALRSYAKTMADAETPPRAIIGKDGQIVGYEDVPDVVLDPQAARREAIMKGAREEMARINRVNAEREAKRDDLKIDLDK